jgi:hypothetical protein
MSKKYSFKKEKNLGSVLVTLPEKEEKNGR